MSPQEVKLPYLNKIRNSRRPREFFYYYRRDGRNIRIVGEIGSREWHSHYQEIHESFESDAPKQEAALAEDIFSEVVVAYRSSRRYLKLKPKTKENYEVELRRLLALFGDLSIRKLNARHISQLRDRISAEKSPRAAKEMMKVVRLVFATAMERAIITLNPVLGVDDPIDYRPEPWRHWEEDEIALFLKHAAPRWRRAVMVLLFTGLRVSDALQVRRQDIKDNVLRWKTEKTGTPVVIPLHRDLIAELERPLDVESLEYLIVSLKGRPFGRASSINHGVVGEFKRLGIDNPPPVHGLRKNAVMRLLEVGCEAEDVHAVTGQSHKMIKHYGKQYDRERRARAAILKWERADEGE